MPVLSVLAYTLITQQTLYPLVVRSDHDEFAKVTKTKTQPKKDAQIMDLCIYPDIFIFLINVFEIKLYIQD